MAYRSAPIADDLIWRAPLPSWEHAFADSVRAKIAEHRPHMLEMFRLDETPPGNARTLAEWAKPTELRSLLAIYSDHIYRNQPTQPRENKPLISLWAQWYLGLMVPPLMLALLTEESAIAVSPEHIHVEFHETGRAACFWVDVRHDLRASQKPLVERMDHLVIQGITPVIEALEATGDINGKLIWSNTGYLINWYLGEMMALLGEEQVNQLRQRYFFSKTLANGQDNPLWRTVVVREGRLARRTCCRENRSGVRSAEQMLAEFAPLNKVDSARRCGLYHGRLEKQPSFDAETFWGEYQLDKLTIKTLPGVFSRDGLDVGSQLLLSTLTPHTKGKVLDVGCGAGVLAATLASHSPKVRLTLCDVSAPAVEASRATLAANGIEGDVLASNVFSEVNGRFDMIISNPPFHDGMQTSLDAAQTLIRGAVRHLNSGGELRIVANAFLPYPAVLDETFGFHEVIAQTGRFKVYRTVMTRQAKKA